MPKYTIGFTERVEWEVDIDAENPEQALQLVQGSGTWAAGISEVRSGRQNVAYDRHIYEIDGQEVRAGRIVA